MSTENERKYTLIMRVSIKPIRGRETCTIWGSNTMLWLGDVSQSEHMAWDHAQMETGLNLTKLFNSAAWLNDTSSWNSQ